MPVDTRYDVFLSYAPEDAESVEVLAQRLADEARLTPFLDQWSLVPGTPWQEGIESALGGSESIAVCVGPSGISRWQNEQMRVALDRATRANDDLRVMPVLLPGSQLEQLPPFLGRRVYVDFRSGLDDDHAFARLIAGIRGHPPEQVDSLALPDEPQPYPGLLSFTANQSAYFFGRASEIELLSSRVRQSVLVAVVGASGSGKSSLVMAGLLPALDPGWRVLAVVPGARPLRALADQVAMLAAPESRLSLADELAVRLRQQPDGLGTALSTLLADRPDVAALLVVVDQLEELFTQVAGMDDEVRQQQAKFIGNLVDAVTTSGGRVRLVMTLRIDFLKRCLEFPELRAALEPNQFLLGPLANSNLREAIIKPAQAVGALFEKGLVGRLMADMRHQPAALPLLQFALAQLWRQRQGVWLTHAGYEAIGGVGGAINQLADAVYHQLDARQQRAARYLLLRLVTVAETTVDTRRRATRAELVPIGASPDEVDRLIARLSQRDVRLIVADEGTVELAHETVIEQWSRLRQWLSEDRAGLLTQRHLTEAAAEWQRNQRDASYLYRGRQLTIAQRWMKAHPDQLNATEQQFLRASSALQRRELLLRTVVVGIGFIAIATVLILMLTETGPFVRRWVWTSIDFFESKHVSVLVEDRNGVLYAGLRLPERGPVLARSRDGGENWEALELAGFLLQALTPDPTSKSRLYVALDTEVLRSDDAGVSWAVVNTTLPMTSPYSIAVSPDGAVYVGDYFQPLGVYVSHDQGMSWSPVTGTPSISTYALVWSNGLWAGTQPGVQLYSEGRWTTVADVPRNTFAVAPADDAVYVGGSGGLYAVRDGVTEQLSSDLQVSSIAYLAQPVPWLLATIGGAEGGVIEWRSGDVQAHLIANGKDLSGSRYANFVRVLDGVWVGTDTGLYRGWLRRWYEPN